MIVMNGMNLSYYGIIAIRGSYNDFVKLPTLKAPSLYSWPDQDNDDVDLSVARKVEASDITMTFLMSADTMPHLMSKKDEFFMNLQFPQWIYLYIGIFDKTFQMYYKGCDSAEFIRGSKYRIKMVLKFRLNN